MATNNVRKFKRKRFRVLKKFILIIMILATMYVLYFEVFKLSRIEIEGSERYTEEEIRKYLVHDKFDEDSLYFYFNYKYRRKPEIPFIQDIDVVLKDRNTVEVTLYEKIVTGCVEFMGEYMYFDKDGIIVESSDQKEEDVLEIVGLQFNRIAMNEQLVVQKQSLFDTILNLTQLIHSYEIPVDKLAFNRDYEVTLTCGKSTVYLGKHDFYDVPLSQLNNILAKSKGKALAYYMQDYTEAGQRFTVKELE